jgi:hypothetical protein
MIEISINIGYNIFPNDLWNVRLARAFTTKKAIIADDL